MKINKSMKKKECDKSKFCILKIKSLKFIDQNQTIMKDYVKMIKETTRMYNNLSGLKVKKSKIKKNSRKYLRKIIIVKKDCKDKSMEKKKKK